MTAVGRCILVGSLIVAGSLALAGTGQPPTSIRPRPDRQQIADGIYLYRTAPYGDVGLDGNSIAILSDDGVLVFDTNGTPAAAAMVLEDIRTLTSQPVRYVVNSHWHWDHWYGTEVYTRAFPEVKVIAHERTRAMMAGPAIGVQPARARFAVTRIPRAARTAHRQGGRGHAAAAGVVAIDSRRWPTAGFS